MRLIDADELHFSMTDSIDQGIAENARDEAPTVDAIPLTDSLLKTSRGDFVVYNRQWLLKNLEMEFEVLKAVRAWQD